MCGGQSPRALWQHVVAETVSLLPAFRRQWSLFETPLSELLRRNREEPGFGGAGDWSEVPFTKGAKLLERVLEGAVESLAGCECRVSGRMTMVLTTSG